MTAPSRHPHHIHTPRVQQGSYEGAAISRLSSPMPAAGVLLAGDVHEMPAGTRSSSKKLGHIPDGGGWRAHGRAATGAQRLKGASSATTTCTPRSTTTPGPAYAEIHTNEN